MAGPRGFRFALAALLVGAPAAAQDPLEGVYIVERMETASMLELAPEGRFRWALSYGALDLRSEGRWRRDGDSVVLDTEPPVTPPRFELVETVHDGTADLSVRVELEDGRAVPMLDVEGEYENGEADRTSFNPDEGTYPFWTESGRRVVAVRVGIRMYDISSERVTVPEGATRLRFRFLPNDLGRAAFRGVRGILADGAILLPVLGEPLRYRRLSAEEARENATMTDDDAEARLDTPKFEPPAH